MRRVFIVQCLCPERHAIAANALEAETEEECAVAGTNLIEALDEAIAKHVLNPWCELCKAPREKWHIETGRTKWTTLTEAMPHLRAEEQAQRESAEQIKASRN